MKYTGSFSKEATRLQTFEIQPKGVFHITLTTIHPFPNYLFNRDNTNEDDNVDV